jgi:hypothetical protein
MTKLIVDLWRCFLLIWKYRRFRHGRVSCQADVVYKASELVGEMRDRYPGRRLFWSFSTNHVIDSSQEYVAVWEVVPSGKDVLAIMVFHGPCKTMRQLVLKGYFDSAFEKKIESGTNVVKKEAIEDEKR